MAKIVKASVNARDGIVYMEPTEECQALIKEITEVMLKHKSIPKVHLLAVMSQVMGGIVAVQGPELTADQAMHVLHMNLAEGNKDFVAKFAGTEVSSTTSTDNDTNKDKDKAVQLSKAIRANNSVH